MKTTLSLIAAILMTGWIVSIAIFSIQNIQPVTIKFLFLESIQMPVGVLLSLCVGVGILIGSILPLFFRRRSRI